MSSSSKDISFRCDLFVQLINQFEKDLYDKKKCSEFLFQLPGCIQDVIYIYFFQEKNEPVIFPNIPPQTKFLDMKNDPENSLEYLNQIVKKDTNGFVEKINPDIAKCLLDSQFNHLLYAIMYLKGSWNGINVTSIPFYNINGKIKENVPFFELGRLDSTVKDGRIIVRTDYIRDRSSYFCLSNEEKDYVLFSKSLKNESEKYNKVNIFLPEILIQESIVTKTSFGKTILQMKYKQNKNGFEAAVELGMCGYGYPLPVKDVYFNEPFRIEIFSKGCKMLEIDVNNL